LSIRKISIVLTLLAAAALVGCPPAEQKPAEPGATAGSGAAQQPLQQAASGEKVPLELYIMSKCPYGAQAAIPAIEAHDQLKGLMDLKIDYIAREENGEFNALHGPPEVKGNIEQLCALQQDKAKALAFITCVSKAFQQIPENTAECAGQTGLDVAALRTCADGEQGKQLLRDSIARANAAGAMGSPTIKVAGEAYRGGRSARDFMRALCAKATTPNEVCAQIPPPVMVKLTVLTDTRCKECQTARYESQLKTFFPGLEIENVDYGTDAGKALYAKVQANVKFLPMLLFDESVTKGEAYQQFERRFQKVAEYYYLPVRANFDPTAEICDNKIDDTNDGKIDCDDPTCKETLVCRPEKKKELAVFVMSQCPYGTRALDAMKPVFEAFGDNIDFKVHYIADKTDTGFRALHGEAEVAENIRQLCAIKYYSKKHKYMDYIWCRNPDIRSTDWQKCTGGKTGIDTAKIEKCSTGEEGKALLAEDIKVAQALQISASPTWLANNRHKFSGVQPEQIKTQFCQQNEGLKGCEKTLSDTAAPVPAGACGK